MWISPHPPLVRACNARQACCNHESFHALSYHEWLASHSSISSSQSVHLSCGKGTVDRRGPRSFEHAMQGTCCNNESVHALSFHERLSSHGLLGSSQISAPELWEGERGSPRRRSFEHATQGTDVANCIGPFHAPASHKWLVTARSSLQLFFLVAAEAFTELECEGKEVPSLARESRTVRGNNLNDAGLQGESTNGYK